jgi:hypothetical protein
LAIIYNDKSILENHHCATGLSILNKPRFSILENLTKEEFSYFRKNFIKVILATDMAQHFAIIGYSENKFANNKLSKDNEEDRVDLMRLIVKAAVNKLIK